MSRNYLSGYLFTRPSPLTPGPPGTGWETGRRPGEGWIPQDVHEDRVIELHEELPEPPVTQEGLLLHEQQGRRQVETVVVQTVLQDPSVLHLSRPGLDRTVPPGILRSGSVSSGP